VDSQLHQRLLRSSITLEERKNVSLVLAALVDERLQEVDSGIIVSVLIKFAILFKAMNLNGEMGPLTTEAVDQDLNALNIADIIDLYVAHMPEES
jgi:hypothetical protein